jgi:hypothetical protein
MVDDYFTAVDEIAAELERRRSTGVKNLEN